MKSLTRSRTIVVNSALWIKERGGLCVIEGKKISSPTRRRSLVRWARASPSRNENGRVPWSCKSRRTSFILEGGDILASDIRADCLQRHDSLPESSKMARHKYSKFSERIAIQRRRERMFSQNDGHISMTKETRREKKNREERERRKSLRWNAKKRSCNNYTGATSLTDKLRNLFLRWKCIV